MKKLFFLLFVILAFVNLVQSQDFTGKKGAEFCSYKRTHMQLPQMNLLSSPNTPKHTYDVLNYKLNFDIYNCFISPYPKNFTASNEITFKVDSTLTTIPLNAVNTSIVVDSVRKIGGPVLTFTHTGNILTVNMDRTYNVGETAAIKIYYRHQNVTDNAFYVSSGWVFTDCEPEGARKIYPCWDRPSDKAKLDLTAKVPTTVRLGSNGRLNDSTIIGDSLWYHWISRDPVATYLIVMTAKVGYMMDRVYWHKLSNPNDSIPILFYHNNNSITWAKQNIKTVADWYSQGFSEHAFEKNGFTTGGPGFVWGGMENQTLTTLCSSCWDYGTVTHEFAHQWWGDMITCASWSNIWLNEGFATWSEAYWLERSGGYAAYKTDIQSDASSYMGSNPGWAISVPSWDITTPDANTLFNYAVTYAKGACVLHLLRYTLGDTVFFNALRAYGSDTVNFRYKSSTIPDFFTKVGSVAGQDLSWFYNAWIYQPNHPVYQNYYNFANLGGGQWRINFTARQTQTNAGFFPIPIMIKFSFATGADTTVRVMNSTNNQMYSFYFNRQPTAVSFDPNNEIVIKTASLVMSADENSSQVPTEFKLAQNFPNPFNPVTNIEYSVPKNSHVNLTVYDLAGKEVKTLVNENKQAGRYTISFNALNLSSGIYFYKITAGDFTDIKKMTLIK